MGFSCKPNIYVSWSTSELRVRLVLWNRSKASSKIFLLTVPRRCFFYGSFILFLSYFCYAFMRVYFWCSWLSFGMSNCEVVTFPLESWVRCGGWLYQFLIFALFVTLCMACFRVRPYARKGLISWIFCVMFNCVFVTFPFGILGQVWYLIVWISDLCRISYFHTHSW